MRAFILKTYVILVVFIHSSGAISASKHVNQCIKDIARHSSSSSLNLISCSLTDEDAPIIAETQSIKYLVISNNQIGSTGAIVLAR